VPRVVREPGSSVLPISIGQIGISLHFFQQGLWERAEERYSSFVSAPRQPFPIFLDAPHATDCGPHLFDFALNGTSLHLGESAAHCSGVRNEYMLDSMLRVLLSLKLLPERGFLLHAATIARGERSYIFMGRSGAGKSTVARHAPVGTALTDEISLVRIIDGVWHAHGTPFWGEFRAGGQNRALPLAGIFALEQAPENHATPLSPRESLRALLPNVLFFSKQPQHRQALLRVTSEISAAVPFFRLRFTRDISLWEELPA
jgi:hypothetical protein